MNVIPVTELRNNISIYINKVVYTGEDIFIKKGKNIVAKIVSVKTSPSTILDLAGLLTETEGEKIKKELRKIKKKDDDPLRYFHSY